MLTEILPFSKSPCLPTMYDAVIYRPAKNAMQSGLKTSVWQVRLLRTNATLIDPVMRWYSDQSTHKQTCLQFETIQAALAYTKAHKLNVYIQKDLPRAPTRPHDYAEHLCKPHMRS